MVIEYCSSIGFVSRLAYRNLCSIVIFMMVTVNFATACDIQLSEAIVDFGDIPRPQSMASVNVESLYDVGQRSVGFTATCVNAEDLSLIVRGLGISNTFKFSGAGQVSVTAKNAFLDGRRVDLSIRNSNNSVTDHYSPSVELAPGVTVVPLLNGLPVAGRIWAMTFEVNAKVPMSDFRTAEAKTPQGLIKLELAPY